MNAKKSLTLTGVALAIASGGSQLAIAGIDRGGKPGGASGAVTAFGSIYVNGVRYNTDNATFIIDGVIGAESDLAVGQIVSVLGSIDDGGETGIADFVMYDDAVEGPVSDIDMAANRMTVLGQTVIVDADTAFALDSGADSLASLSADDIVEVSGYTDADGNVHATYVGESNGANGFDLTGTVTSVSTGGLTFAVNGLHVDYSSANLYDLPGGTPQAGQRVEILGTPSPATGQFVAEHVWTAYETLGADTGLGEVEGLITGWQGFGVFEIDGVAVRVSWDTDYVNGWIFDLSLNRKVEVEGEFDEDGVLDADSIEFERGAELNHAGHVDAVDEDVVYINGLGVRVTPETAYEDDSDEDERRFGVGNLRAGDLVEIRGYVSDDGVVATRLERDDDDNSDPDEDDDE